MVTLCDIWSPVNDIISAMYMGQYCSCLPEAWMDFHLVLSHSFDHFQHYVSIRQATSVIGHLGLKSAEKSQLNFRQLSSLPLETPHPESAELQLSFDIFIDSMRSSQCASWYYRSRRHKTHKIHPYTSKKVWALWLITQISKGHLITDLNLVQESRMWLGKYVTCNYTTMLHNSDTNVSHYPVCGIILALTHIARQSTSENHFISFVPLNIPSIRLCVACRNCCCINGKWAHYSSLLEPTGLFVLYFLSNIFMPGEPNDKVQLFSAVCKFIKLLLIFCLLWFIDVSVWAESCTSLISSGVIVPKQAVNTHRSS